MSGFAKSPDIEYFVRSLVGIEYRSEDLLTPTAEILNGYRGGELDWPCYAERYLELLDCRNVAEVLRPDDFADAVLMCSEPLPEKCHRRLAAEYLSERWGDVRIVHL